MHAACTLVILQGGRAPLCCMCKERKATWRAEWSISTFAQGGGHADLGYVAGWEVHGFAGQGFRTQRGFYTWSVYGIRSTHTAMVTIVCGATAL